MKFVIIVALFGVLVALGSAGAFMLRKRPADPAGAQAPDRRMAWALAARVSLSVLLFAFILFAWWMGWIQPTGLPAGR